VSAVRRTRSLARKGLKVQRRVVLAQALFWPAVLGGLLTIGAVTFAVRRATQPDKPGAAVADGGQPDQLP
jgi:hypothetical protein